MGEDSRRELKRLRYENRKLDNQLRDLVLADVKRVQIQEELDTTKKLYARLVEVVSAFSSQKSISELFNTALEFIIYEIGVQRCVIAYADDNTEFLPKALDGYYSLSEKKLIDSLSFTAKGDVGRVLLAISTFTILPEVDLFKELQARLQLTTIGVVPIRVLSETKGFIFLGSEESKQAVYAAIKRECELENILNLLSLNLGRTIGNAQIISEIIAANKKIEELALHDPLTGLFNRRGLQNKINQELENLDVSGCIDQQRKRHNEIGIILADIDHFKKINDTYGHDYGDYILEEVSSMLKANTRHTDSVGRWGGEEFLIILPETDLSGAAVLAEKIREVMEKRKFRFDGKTLGITMSFGVCSYGKSGDKVRTIDEAIKCADLCLYDAKRSGRNRIVSFDKSIHKSR